MIYQSVLVLPDGNKVQTDFVIRDFNSNSAHLVQINENAENFCMGLTVLTAVFIFFFALSSIRIPYRNQLMAALLVGGLIYAVIGFTIFLGFTVRYWLGG